MYASADDMIARFGQAEMIRLTTPDGTNMVAVVADTVERALIDASALIDTYVRCRYAAPMDVPPAEIQRAACVLARYDLMHGDQREPTEQARLARKEVLDWLQRIADGTVRLDLAAVGDTTESHAQARTRRPVFGGECGGW